MNTKRHRCSRANIIRCNYDNTRLIQDVGIRVGWDAFHQYSNNQRFFLGGGDRGNCRFMPNIFSTFN